MSGTQTLAQRITERLQSQLGASRVDVKDDSAAHAGHAGSSGGAHVQLVVVAEAFRGKSSLQRHRMVNELFREELKAEIHALQLTARAPDEAV